VEGKLYSLCSIASHISISGLTSISIWLLSCIVFVAAAVAEYAGILYLKRNLDCCPPLTGSELGNRTVTMNKVKT
jgi:hypothetical protein